MQEIWKDVPGYEGQYQVSNIGRVRSLDRIKPDGIFQHGIIRKTHLDACGYELVALRKNNKTKHWSVHRLVATAFIPNPYNLPQVNHKDEIRNHNTVDNLEWCTIEYNQRYGHRRQRSSESSIGEKNARAILNEKEVIEIRKTYIPGDKEFGVSALSKKYGVKYVTITKIIGGKLWKHLLKEDGNDHKGIASNETHVR